MPQVKSGPEETLKAAATVMPAKAGIQSLVWVARPRHPLHANQVKIWIPAYAGWTASCRRNPVRKAKSGFGQQLEVLHLGRAGEEGADDGAPFGEGG